MTTEEQLQTLTEKLAALEAQMQPQSGASSSSSSASPGPITVKVPRERKLRKFAGSRDDHLIEDWILDAERATTGQSDADAVDFLLYHLDGAAKEEVRLRPTEERANPAAVFTILRNSFGEGLTSTQAMRKFFERRQRERETIQEYSHSLMVLLSRVERLNAAAVTDKDRLLRDQFLENLHDPQLRRDIKRWARDHPTKSFQEIREEVQRWVDEDKAPARRAAGVREAAVEDHTCDEVKARTPSLQAVLNELVAGQKLLAENLQKQQKLLADQIRNQQSAFERQQRDIAQLMSSRQQWSPPNDQQSGFPGTRSGRDNFRNDGRGRGRKPDDGFVPRPPALNGKTPRQ